jgi:hypothetical protein
MRIHQLQEQLLLLGLMCQLEHGLQMEIQKLILQIAVVNQLDKKVNTHILPTLVLVKHIQADILVQQKHLLSQKVI